MARRAREGDVLEIVAPQGTIYLHYLGKHKEYGDAVAVCPTTFPDPAVVNDDLFRRSYVVFYPASVAVARGLARVVGHLRSQGVPPRLRRPGVRSSSGIETWVVEDSSGEVIKRRLTDADLRLPLAVIWNHEFLVQRVVEGWRPESEGRGH